MEKSKSRSLKLASRLIGYIGVGACLLAAIAYFIMHELGYQIKAIGPFQWEHLYYVAAVAGVIILIALILRIASSVARKKELYSEEYEEIEEEDEEECYDNELEVVEENPEAVAEKRCICDIIREKAKITPETKEKVIATLKKNAPVIAAVAATVVVTATVNKIANDRRKAKIRRNILDLLY